jgi:hypothetical protein
VRGRKLSRREVRPRWQVRPRSRGSLSSRSELCVLVERRRIIISRLLVAGRNAVVCFGFVVAIGVEFENNAARGHCPGRRLAAVVAIARRVVNKMTRGGGRAARGLQTAAFRLRCCSSSRTQTRKLVRSDYALLHRLPCGAPCAKGSSLPLPVRGAHSSRDGPALPCGRVRGLVLL